MGRPIVGIKVVELNRLHYNSRMRIFGRIFWTTILLISALLITLPALAQGPVKDFPGAPEFVPGEILVKFKPHVGALNGQRSLEAEGLRALEISPYSKVIRVQAPPGQEEGFIARLKARGDVEYAEPNYIAYAFYTPNDPSFGSQWGMPKINLPDAWDITQGSSSIIVAIVDTGIDLDHPDFSCTVPGGAGKLTGGWNFVAGNNNPDDDNSHGSHVAGIVGACTNNSAGVAGTAPNVRLMPVKVLDSAGSGTYEGVAAGIDYAVANGAKIINLSLGGSEDSITLANAVQNAYNNGVLVIAAAGNCAQGWWPCPGVNPIMYPAAYPETMAVGATDSADNWASFSEYHDYVEVSAPGVNIYSTWAFGSYGNKTGTSMSTPYVTGLAALLWSMNPASLTHNAVRQTIQSTAVDLGTPGKDVYFGYGRIDAKLALQSLTLQTSPAQTSFLIDDQSGPLVGNVQITTFSTDSITWTTTISPGVSWLNVTPPDSGSISASSSPVGVTLVATKPVTYGTYATIVVVTGTTSSGGIVGPATTQVEISYVPKLTQFYFPIIFKN